MSIDLGKEERQQSIESIQRYFKENMDEPIGNMSASALLSFFIEEIGPCLYNQGVADAQKRLQTHLDDLGFEVSEETFTHWHKPEKKPKR